MYKDYMDNLFNIKQDTTSSQAEPVAQTSISESLSTAQPPLVKVPEPTSQASTEVGKIYAYDVRRGDSIYQVAKRFDTSVEFIRALNHLHENLLIHAGQKLLIPVLYKRPQPRPQPKPYVQSQPMTQPMFPHRGQPVVSPMTQNTAMANRQSYDLYF